MNNKRAIKFLICFLMLLVLCAVAIIAPACSNNEALESSNNKPQYEINSVGHRGYYSAPENTLTAFRKAKEIGFKIVECDVNFTSDDQPVIIHDDYIDRTSDGTGNVNGFTFDEIRQYDFGSWKGEEYIGERIPSFEEFISLCSELQLNAYVELKSYIGKERASKLYETVKKYNMENSVSWISFSFDWLLRIAEINPEARLGILAMSITEELIEKTESYKKDYENFFIDCDYTALNEESIALCKEKGIKLEVWTVDDIEAIKNLDRYVSGVTSNSYVSERIINNKDNLLG